MNRIVFNQRCGGYTAWCLTLRCRDNCQQKELPCDENPTPEGHGRTKIGVSRRGGGTKYAIVGYSPSYTANRSANSNWPDKAGGLWWGEPSMNAPVSWYTGHSRTRRVYTCTLLTFDASNIATMPATRCFTENDECVWYACLLNLLLTCD